MNHGHVVYDGPTDDGIAMYMGIDAGRTDYVFAEKDHRFWKRKEITLSEIHILEKQNSSFFTGEKIKGRLDVVSEILFKNLYVRFEISNSNKQKICTVFSNSKDLTKGKNKIFFEFDTTLFVPGRYIFDVVLYGIDGFGGQRGIDGVYPGFVIDIFDERNEFNALNWSTYYWGNIHLPNMNIE